MKKFRYIILYILITGTLNSSAQVSVNYNAALYGRSLDGLSFAQLINASTIPVYAKIKITIRELTQGLIATIQVPYTQVRPGSNSVNNKNFTQSSFTFSNNSTGMQLSRTGRLGEGEYDFCFEVTVGDPKTQIIQDVTENCFQSSVEPLAPLFLVDPAPGDKFCNPRPNFTWQPPVPFQRNMQYRIIVCEQNDQQAAIEAITYNIPVINISGIYNNNLFFPPKTPDLKQGKKYVWQVTAYQDKTILTKSEIWQFEIKCDEQKKNVTGDSYRELKESEDGNYYVADKVLKISFYNPYNPGILNYSIVSLSNPDKKIKKIPELKLATGLNKHEIDLSENNAFKNGQEYQLTVWLANNRTLKLRFIYRNDEEK